MSAARRIEILSSELRTELTERILPFWMEKTVDTVNGGFVGRITHSGVTDLDAPKGAVLNARILWTYAAAAKVLDESALFDLANRAHQYLRDHFWDYEHGGVFWSLDRAGEPLDEVKRIYAQAFCIYALAEKFQATGDTTALDEAIKLFRTIEEHGFDPRHGGYFETFSREWGAIDDMRLSETDDNAPKSMNTQLHVLEAYTNLYRCWPAAILYERLAGLIKAFVRKILDPDSGQMCLFFESDWSLRSRTFSYGHDIEAAWLLLRAVDELDEPELRRKVEEVAIGLADATADRGQDKDGGIFWTGDRRGPIDTDKHWWPQAEAIVGFLTVFQETGDQRYLKAAEKAWAFTKLRVLDAGGGEWFGRVSQAGVPYADEDQVNLWKCPYHNVRACLEVMNAGQLEEDAET
jgi:mannobiose 2-epimerase